MEKNNKKTIYIIVGSIILIALIVLAFFYFRKPSDRTTSNNNPFGSSDATNNTPSNNKGNKPSDPNNGGGVGEVVTFWQIYDKPTSGATVIENGSSTIVRLVDRATGNVYQENIIDKKLERISNTTIPKTQETVWGKNGNTILFRYEEGGNIKTYHAKVGTTTGSDQGLIAGKYLSDDIGEIVSSVGGDKIFYSLEIQNAGALLTSNIDGSNPNKIFVSRFYDWLLAWPNDNTLTAATKPSAFSPGYLYIVNTKNKQFNKILGPTQGMTALVDKKVEQVLFSESTRDSFTFNLFNVKTIAKRPINPTTLPEKCVWDTKRTSIIICGAPKVIPKNSYPDAWYQGKISFSDTLWVYDVTTGATDLLLDLEKEVGSPVDVISPLESQKGDLLIFRNKNDYTLWGLKIDQNKIPEYFD